MYHFFVAPVAQWIRASVSGTEGHTFKSCRVYQNQALSLTFLLKYAIIKKNIRLAKKGGLFMKFIVNEQSPDEQGRINVGALYPKERPEQIVIVIESETKRILFLLPEEAENWGVRQTIDKKGRVVLSKWLRSEIGGKSTTQVTLNLVVEKKDNDGIVRFAEIKTARALPKPELLPFWDV